MLLSKICKILCIEFTGEDVDIAGIGPTSSANENEITFLWDEKYINELKTTKAAAILCDEKFSSLIPKTTVVLPTSQAYLQMAIISKYFAQDIINENGNEPVIGENTKIYENVFISKDTKIGSNVTIMPGSFLASNVQVGDNTVIYPNVTIYNNTTIGNGVILQAGSVIGSDGYGFAYTKLGEHVKIYHNGKTVIEDNVEIGANCAIDKAVFGKTIIKKGTKIDNLVHIAHNCEVGENCLFAGQTGLAGSTKIGQNVIMGGQSGTAGHLEITDFVTIAGKAGVTKSIKEKGTYSGFPHMPHKKWLRLQGLLSRLLK
jgi:UDP-3-O-[3-hydroxymyristoyl] glucosamine N-acyltransferase